MLVLKEFRNKLEEVLNNCQLPIDAAYFVLKDVFNEVMEIYNQEIQKEEMNKIQKEQEQKEEISDNVEEE